MLSETVDFGLLTGRDTERKEKKKNQTGWDESFANWLVIERCISKKEAIHTAYRLRVILALGDGPLLNEDKARELAGRILQMKSAKGTIRHNLYALERYMEYLGMPVKFKKPRATVRCPKYLNQGQLRALIHVVNDYREYALIATFIYTGARLNEVCMLNVGDVDFGRKIITVRHAKMNKDREIPLDPSLERVLKAYLSRQAKDHLRQKAPLFWSLRKQRISPHAVWQIIKKVAIRAGLPDVHPHVLRHSFATAWAENGGDVFHLQDVLGHSDITMTQRYWHVNSNSRRIAFERGAPRLS
jgi:site-specific recombinase XerD